MLLLKFCEKKHTSRLNPSLNTVERRFDYGEKNPIEKNAIGSVLIGRRGNDLLMDWPTTMQESWSECRKKVFSARRDNRKQDGHKSPSSDKIIFRVFPVTDISFWPDTLRDPFIKCRALIFFSPFRSE